MVSRDDIRDNQEFYVPSLLALSELSDEAEVRTLLEDCSVTLRTLRDRYLEDQTELVDVQALAALAPLPLDRFQQALAYLMENVSPIAGSQGGPDGVPLKVLPAERVLLLENIESVLEELRNYRKLRATWSGLSLEEAASPSHTVNAAMEQRAWLEHVPVEIRALLAETYSAREVGLRALVLMGVRAAIDMSCNHLIGDKGTFESKLAELLKSGLVTTRQRDTLHAVVQLGHASAHRGHMPSVDDVNDALDVLERLLKDQYSDQHTAKRLRDTTPQRR